MNAICVMRNGDIRVIRVIGETPPDSQNSNHHIQFVELPEAPRLPQFETFQVFRRMFRLVSERPLVYVEV